MSEKQELRIKNKEYELRVQVERLRRIMKDVASRMDCNCDLKLIQFKKYQFKFELIGYFKGGFYDS